MSALLAFLSRLIDPFRRQTRDHALEEELDAHLQLHIDDNRRMGMTEAEARRQAMLKLGGVDQTKERYRDRRGLPFVDALQQDIRQALRVARGNVGFTLVAMATLALGIGAVGVIYSVVRNILLDPFPYVHSDRMVDVVLRDAVTTKIVRGALPGPEFLDFQEQSTVFEEVLGTLASSAHFVADDDAERVAVVHVTPNMFSFLGVAPLVGRAVHGRRREAFVAVRGGVELSDVDQPPGIGPAHDRAHRALRWRALHRHRDHAAAVRVARR